MFRCYSERFRNFESKDETQCDPMTHDRRVSSTLRERERGQGVDLRYDEPESIRECKEEPPISRGVVTATERETAASVSETSEWETDPA